MAGWHDPPEVKTTRAQLIALARCAGSDVGSTYTIMAVAGRKIAVMAPHIGRLLIDKDGHIQMPLEVSPRGVTS